MSEVAVAVPEEPPRVVSDLLATDVVRAMGVKLPQPVLRMLQLGTPYIFGHEDLSGEAIVAGQTAARLGYLARRAGEAVVVAAAGLSGRESGRQVDHDPRLI